MRRLAGVARSAAWIAGIQAVNFLVPLAALPFIVRGLGVEQFSRYSVLVACGTFLVIFVDYSLNVTGPLRVRRALAEGRLAALLLDSLVLKGVLILPASAAFLAAALALGGVGAGDAALALGHALAVTLTPRWVVYSLGRLRAFALLAAAARLAWLAAVVWGVRGPEDLSLLLAVSLAAQAAMLIGSSALVWPGMGPAAPGLSGAKRILREDLGQFGAILAGSAGRELNLVLLAAFAAAPAVAAYALADKVRVLMAGLVAPVTQALYLAIVGADRGTEGWEAGFRGPASIVVLLAAAAGGAAVFVLAERIVLVLGGPELAGAASVLRVFCLLPVLTALTAILGTNTLLAEGRGDLYAAAQMATALLGVPLTVAAILQAGPVGAAWAAVALEAGLALVYAVALRRTGLMARVLR